MKSLIPVLVLIGSGLMLAGVFARPLGIPSEFELIPGVAGVVCLFLAVVMKRKAMAAGLVRAPSEAAKRKYFWLFSVVVVCTCLSGPLILPFTGVRLPFWELVVVSIVTFVMMTAILWCGLMMKK